MTDEQTIDFCKVDSDLDANPKIQKAGCLGRDVFEFVLRVNRRKRSNGEIPQSFVEPSYLAKQLMLDQLALRFGVNAGVLAADALADAVSAGLLELDQDARVVRIVGWEAEWGTREPKPGRERTRVWRERRDAATSAMPIIGDAGDARDAGDAIRSEEIRGEERRDHVLAPDSDNPVPELPDPPAIADLERDEPAQSFAFGEQRSAESRRRLLWGEAWTHAATKHFELKAAGVDASARNCWSGTTQAVDAAALRKIIEDLTDSDALDRWERAAETVRNRIEVAAAEARRDQTLRWFTPARMWDPRSFSIASALTPEQAGQPRAGPRGTGPSSPPPDPPFRRSKKLD